MDERQVKHFKFRQMRRISTGVPLPKGSTGKFNLLCCANNYGMLFIGGSNCFAVCHTAMLYKVNDEDSNDRNEAVSLDKLKPVMVSVPGQPCYLGLSADELTLSVCLRESSLPCMLYDTRSFCESRSQTPRPFAVVNLADTAGGVQVFGLSWNPVQPECFAVCLSNGSVSIWENQGTSVKCLATSSNCEASSICWSPKGKQLAVGHKDGRLSQFSPQMELKKDYPPPEALTEKHEVSGLFWISTHQFALVLTPSGAPIGKDDGLPPPSHFMILTALKKKAPEYEDFDDIYYGMGNNEPHFFFSVLSTWNILITSSSSASESMVLSKQPGSEVAWEKWNLEDEGRAELPVHGTDDTFPCGMCLDLTSTVPIPYGENSEIPPSPLFILLSDYGLLTPYMVFNVEPPPGTGYDFVKPPQVLDKTRERLPPSSNSIQGSTPVATSNAQVLQPKVLISTTTTVALTTVNPAITTVTGTPLVSKILANETFAPSSTFARTFSLDKKPVSFSLPPFSMGGSLPNLLTTSSAPLPTAANTLLLSSLPKPPSVVTTLNQAEQKAPLSSSNITLPPSNITTTAAAAAAKTPLGSFKQPLLSSTPISAASQKVMSSGMPSSIVMMPPPSMPPSRLVSAATTLPTTSTVMPAALQKIASSYAPPMRPSAPSPTLSVTSSVEEENVEKNLIAAIEQEIEEFSEQLQEHFDDIQEAFCSDLDLPDDCLCAIGSEEDRINLVNGQEKMFTEVNSLLDQTKDLSSMVESLMDEVLECRSLYEEGKDGLRMRRSNHYREYVKKKPLTPLLQNLLDGVHTRYTIAEARVRELSAQVDADVERRKELEAIRVGGAHPPLQTPTYHNVYTTLKNNRRITRLQSTNIDHLVQKMKNMSVLPRAWNFASSTPLTSSQSIEHDKATRQSQALLNEVKGVMTPEKQAKRKKQPLFSKYSPERLLQFQKLFNSSVQSTSMQTIPLVTSFAHKSSTGSTTTPVPYEEEVEDDEITLSVPQGGVVEPHTPPTFSANQPGKLLHQLPGNSTQNQLPSQSAHFVSQPSHSTNQLQQDILQFPEPHPPLSNPPYGLPPLNQVPSNLSQHSNMPQPRVDPTGQQFLSQAYVTSVPPPPPPLQPTLQGHDIAHHGASISATPATATKTPGEMAAEAALKRQQSACGASSVVSQSMIVTTTVTNTPVVVITASEMPLSSLFFTGKSKISTSKPSTTESTMGVHQFGSHTSDHTTSVPGNFQFKFSLQNPSSSVPPFLTSTTGSQSSLTFGLSASNNDKFSMGSGGLFSKSETSFAKPADSTAPPANSLSSKSESNLFEIAVTTSSAKPTSLLSLLTSTKASGPSISDSLTKLSSGQTKGQVTNEEENNEQPEDEQDNTLTKPHSSSTVATPVLSLNAKSVLSGSTSTLATPVISSATPIIPATTIKSSVTFSAPSVTTTLPVSTPSILMTKAPPTSVELTVAPPTLSKTAIATSTASMLSTLLSSVVSTAAPPTLIADSVPVTLTATSTVSNVSSANASTSGAPPINESAAPPITESTAAPPIAEATAPPSTTAVAPPTTTTAVRINPVSVNPPTPSSTAPPTISSSFSIKTSEANVAAVTTPLTFPMPLLRVADKPSDSEGESDVIDNGIDRVASQSSLASNMTDDINIVDESEGEMEKEPAPKETSLNQGFTSLFGEKKTTTNSMATSNPFGSSGNVSDGSSSLSTGLHSAHTPSIGSGSGFLAPSKFSQGGLGQSSGLGTGMNIRPAGWLGQASVGVGQTGMGVSQTGMGVGQTGMGAGSNTPGLGGPRFGSSAMFSSQPQFGTRPLMGNSMMGATSNARVFGSSLQSDGQSLNFGTLAAGGGQTFGGIATNQGIGSGTGTGIGGMTKSSFQAWR